MFVNLTHTQIPVFVSNPKTFTEMSSFRPLYWYNMSTYLLIFGAQNLGRNGIRLVNMALRTCLLYEERSIENVALRNCLLYEGEGEEYKEFGFKDLFHSLLYEEEERSIENVAFRNSLLYEVEEERSRENMALRTFLLYEEEEEYRKCGFQDLFAV